MTRGDDRRVPKLRVVQLITRLIVGGAQETALRTAVLLGRDPRFEIELWTGPETGSEGSLHEEAARSGVEVRIVPEMRRAIAPAQDLRVIQWLRRELNQRRIDVLHTHSSKAGIVGRWAARSSSAEAVVHTVHGWPFAIDARPWERRLYLMLERRAARWCDALIVVAESDRESGLRCGIGREAQYRLIRSGIPLDPFREGARRRVETRVRLSIPPGTPVVGSVLRLSEQKAPLDLIRAFGGIASALADARFLVVGDGPLRQEAERESGKLGLADRVSFLGLRRDVPELLGAMDVFLLPSLWEGLPRTLIQAMASGVPVVCSDIPGNREAIGTDGAGILVPPRNPEAMASAAVHVLRPAVGESAIPGPESGPSFRLQGDRIGQGGDLPGRAELIERGRLRAEAFDERQMASELAALYLAFAGRTAASVFPKGSKPQGP